MADKKKIAKAIKSLEEQIEKHKLKIKSHGKDKDYLMDYWEKQIKVFEEEIRKKRRKLGI